MGSLTLPKPPLLVAILPVVAMCDGKKKMKQYNALSVSCHHCHLFLKRRGNIRIEEFSKSGGNGGNPRAHELKTPLVMVPPFSASHRLVRTPARKNSILTTAPGRARKR